MTHSARTHGAPTLAGAGAERQATVLGALLVVGLGVFLLIGAGFAQSQTLHDATHDIRHAHSLPCH